MAYTERLHGAFEGLRAHARAPKSATSSGIISALLLAGGRYLPAQTAIPAEYQIKAVFLFNLAQFVDWPSNAFPEAQAPLVTGILRRIHLVPILSGRARAR